MQQPRKIDRIDEQRIGDELYLYGTDGEKLTVLNSTAMLIWSLCDGTHSVEDMVDVINDILPEVPGSELADDIQQTLAGLSQKKLITDYP